MKWAFNSAGQWEGTNELWSALVFRPALQATWSADVYLTQLRAAFVRLAAPDACVHVVLGPGGRVGRNPDCLCRGDVGESVIPMPGDVTQWHTFTGENDRARG